MWLLSCADESFDMLCLIFYPSQKQKKKKKKRRRKNKQIPWGIYVLRLIFIWGVKNG